jgi:hypothetical protein
MDNVGLALFWHIRPTKRKQCDILILKNSYILRASLTYHQELHLYLNTLQPIGCSKYCLYIRLCVLYTDDLTTVPLVGDDGMA